MKIPTPIVASLASLAVMSCVTITGPPERIAAEIVVALEEGNSGEASNLFERVQGDEDYRQQIYPVIYDAARNHYNAGETAQALDLLRFMVPRYPDARALREALVYSLFLERASAPSPEAGLARELDGAIEALAERSVGEAPWLALIETQTAIDRGQFPEARKSFERFLAGWQGGPEPVAAYVDDLGRYLAMQ